MYRYGYIYETYGCSTVIPHLSCPCGGAGKWSKIVSLDMTDPNQQCPSNSWSLNTFSGIRGCGRTMWFSILPIKWSDLLTCVHGKIIAYQQGHPDALSQHLAVNVSVACLEGIYVDGISLTHAVPGSRSHIRTYGHSLKRLWQFFVLVPTLINGFNCSFFHR